MTSTDPEIGSSINAAGIKINYHDMGDGQPVLLIHGSGPGVSAWANWQTVMPALSRQHRVIAPDIVGFGYTDRPDDFQFIRDSWTAHLVAFVDALDLPEVSIVGNSFGGALALWFASQYPHRVRRLVLMGSAGVSFPITPALDAVWGYEPSLERMAEVMKLFAFDRSRITDDLVRLRYEASIRPGIAESYSQMFPSPRQNAVEALALSDDRIRQISQETLVVHGRDDRVIPLQTSLRLNQLIDNSEMHVFGRCGHWVQIEAGERFAALVDGFLHR